MNRTAGQSKLTLICGLPNAGKTTYSKRYGNVIHLDDLPIKGGQFNTCNAKAGCTKGDICVEGVFGTAEQRKNLVRACKCKFPKICIWLDVSVKECVDREFSYRKRPVGIIYSHHESFEPPTYDEGWDEIIRITT